MADIKDRAREYIAEHSEYSEVFGETFVAVYTLTAMVEFAEQETKELKAQVEGKENEFKYFSNSFNKKIAELQAQIEKMKCCGNCQTVRDAEGNCYLKKDGKCKDKDKWELKEIKEK